MHTRRIAFIAATLFLATAPVARAGFGITPPYVKNSSLTRTSHYEQKIILVRSDPVEDLRADISIDVRGAEGWITVDRGLTFTMPRGEKQVPIVVNVDVPAQASFGTYKGNMKVKVSPPQGPTPGSVGIVLGAQIDVDLSVIDQQIVDFRVRRVDVKDLNAGHSVFGMYFPGKVLFTMQVENIGNVAGSPAKVALDLYDQEQRTRFESLENTNRLRAIEPFETSIIVAEFPTRMGPGSYKAIYRIYKTQDTVAQEGTLDLAILPYGTLQDPGYGLEGLRMREKAMLGGIGGGVLALVLWVIVASVRSGRSSRRSRRGGGFGSSAPPPPSPTRRRAV